MDIEWLYIYIYGWIVTGMANVAKLTLRDFFVSFLVSLTWPVSLPAHLLRRFLR